MTVSQRYPEAIDSAEKHTVPIEISFSIDAEAPDGYYDIVHILPAGLDFMGLARGSSQKGVWVSEVRGKQVTFSVFKDKQAKRESFTFDARVTMTGSFMGEGTYIAHAAKPEFTSAAAGGRVIIE